MPVVLMDGFDYYAAAEAPQVGWSGVMGSMQAGQYGGQAVRPPGAATREKGLPAAGATFSVAARVRQVSSLAVSTSYPLFALLEGATTHIMVIPSTAGDGKIVAYRGTTLLGTSAASVLTLNAWHWINVIGVIHDTTGSVRILVDGVEALNLTGQDTRNAGTTGLADTLRISSDSGGKVRDYDDLIVRDDSTAISDHRIATLLPNGNGTSSQFTGSDGNSTDNYLLVDEVPHNSDTDYVESSTAGQIDTYAMDNLPAGAASVLAVQQRLVARKTDAGARSGRTVVRSGGANYEGSDIALADNYVAYGTLRLTDPATAAAWTVANVNALEAGAKVQS